MYNFSLREVFPWARSYINFCCGQPKVDAVREFLGFAKVIYRRPLCPIAYLYNCAKKNFGIESTLSKISF